MSTPPEQEPNKEGQPALLAPAGEAQPAAAHDRHWNHFSGWSRYVNIGSVLAVIALGLASWQVLDSRQRINGIEQELAKRLAESASQNTESRVISTQAQEATREIQVKLGLLETKLQESQDQQVALEALYQELSRNRDEWALADIEQTLAIASQQLQLSGNVRAALIALQSVDSRLQRLDKPQFIGLRKALSKDIERLKALPFVDTVGISLRLDGLIAVVDQLPLAYQSVQHETTNVAREQTKGQWWQQLWHEVWQDLRQLVQIHRMERADAPILAPSQAYFLRENLRLRLISARIALLQHDETSYKEDLKAVREWINRYYDGSAKITKEALATLRQLSESTVGIETPDISGSLDAVRNLKIARERNPR
jgi:uroporphyrin-3 C-methyltransferase